MTQSDNFHTTLDRFHAYLSGILELYQNLVPLLKQELEAIQQGNIYKLNESMKPQQSLLLETRGIEEKIAKYMLQLGIQANNMSELILQLPEDDQQKFQNLLRSFGKTLTEVAFYKEQCRVLLESKLYHLKSLSAQQEISTYDRHASEVDTRTAVKSFEIKI